jgi:hypothetical protein
MKTCMGCDHDKTYSYVYDDDGERLLSFIPVIMFPKYLFHKIKTNSYKIFDKSLS